MTGVEQSWTTAYSSEENGIVKRSNQEVLRHFNAILFDSRVHDRWSFEKLPMVLSPNLAIKTISCTNTFTYTMHIYHRLSSTYEYSTSCTGSVRTKCVLVLPVLLVPSILLVCLSLILRGVEDQHYRLLILRGLEVPYIFDIYVIQCCVSTLYNIKVN